MGKRIFVVSNDLCNGCRNCEMWCSFCATRHGEFNRMHSRIKLFTDSEGKLNIPTVDCNGKSCLHNEKGEPLCVEMCPTGTLVYTEIDDLYQKRIELEEKRRKQPLFRLIVPWKYPYPWREWPNPE